MKTLYDVLGIRPDADPEAIRQAFRRAVKAHHPDVSGSGAAGSEKFQDIVAASEVLRDPEQRAVYDRQLALERELSQVAWRDALIRAVTAAVAVALVLVGGSEVWIALTRTQAGKVPEVARPLADVAAAPAEPDLTAGGMDLLRGASASRESEPPPESTRREVADDNAEPDTAMVGQSFSALSPPISDQAFRDRIIDWASKVDLDRDIADLDEALRLAPNDAEAHRRRGNLWGRKGDTDRALADYAEAIRIDPNDIAIFHDRGVMWQRNGELDKALVDLDRAVRMSFADPEVYSDRGAVWLEKGRYDRALADFNQALKIAPGLVTAYARRATALDRKEGQERTRADLDQATHLDRGPPPADRTGSGSDAVGGR
jgi:curved DNA-binding protein CbpA/regulator of sirC expression with transglutaminase-like and TPR domain